MKGCINCKHQPDWIFTNSQGYKYGRCKNTGRGVWDDHLATNHFMYADRYCFYWCPLEDAQKEDTE